MEAIRGWRGGGRGVSTGRYDPEGIKFSHTRAKTTF